MAAEDEVQGMDESTVGDLDEMALPDLPDSVWMRLLANALDPDAPATGLDLIPDDQPAPPGADDAVSFLGVDDDLGVGDAETGAGDDGNHDGGSDLLPSQHEPSDDSGVHHLGHDAFGAEPFGAEPWNDHHDH